MRSLNSASSSVGRAAGKTVHDDSELRSLHTILRLEEMLRVVAAHHAGGDNIVDRVGVPRVGRDVGIGVGSLRAVRRDGDVDTAAFIGGHRAKLCAHVVSGRVRIVERVRLRALRSILFIVLRCILIPAAPHHQHDHKHQHDEDGDEQFLLHELLLF